MPAIAALTINDGAASPVAHVFSPVTTNGSLAKWADRAPAIPAGYQLISHEVAAPSGTRTTYKVTMGFSFPVVATVDGALTVVRYSSAQVILNIHPDSLLQERDDALTYIANFCNHASVKSSVENLEPFY
jgi:hypothetical protein